jgi:L-ascorbate metabolism protein UlaG (beta-lactamase superfamily)
MRLTHVGHSCVVVETGGARVLIDPGTFADGWESITSLDAVLITHTHPDHCDRDRLPTLLAANPGAIVAAEPDVAAELSSADRPVRPLSPGDALAVGDTQVTVAGGQHAVIHADIPRVGNVGVLLRAPGEPSLFHPGDSYEAIPAGVDVLAAPLNAPWSAFKETVEFVRAVKPGLAFPIHDGLLNDRGRALYLRQLTALARTEVRDLAEASEHIID